MEEFLRGAELFQGLNDDELERLAELGRRQSLRAGEYLFLLGDTADRLYVVAKGQVDLCFPISLHGATKDISLETVAEGETVGWSALVKPYLFTLSARVNEPGEVVAFTRHELLQFFGDEPGIGYAFLTKISELVGIRLMKVQALWARELQRTLTVGAEHRAH